MTDSNQSKKVLIVDDDHRLRQIVCTTIGTEFQIVEASNGPQALTLARSDDPDLILLDVNMPGVDGFRVCRILKNDPLTSQIPIVMLTGRGRRKDIQMGRDMGANDYIVKPFSPLGLLNKVYEIFKEPVQP
jgi:two-component system alkaline phosphatase synthesis response regulator PhoP